MFATNGAMTGIQTQSLSLKGERTFVSFVLFIANKNPRRDMRGVKGKVGLWRNGRLCLLVSSRYTQTSSACPRRDMVVRLQVVVCFHVLAPGLLADPTREYALTLALLLQSEPPQVRRQYPP